ncbi:MAG: quinolinate synthase NadA [Bacteroidia bacterium]|nr:quinolinate synthase NadA [Bacteroidia bacterium]MDW8014472.1 quinolinate synthase NadA [Bacteroidia bacterium]
MFHISTASSPHRDIATVVEKYGYIPLQPPLGIDLFAEIERLKKEKNAILLAHYYQDADIQDIADFVGDSLGLSQRAAETDADIILFAGVHFMAETAKILNPNKKVLIPDLNAGCSLSDSCPPDEFAAFKLKYPDYKVVSYINTSAAIKAMSDIIVTSSNAVPIVKALPSDWKIIFAPDRNLGMYVMKKTGREMVLWNGVCMVHTIFSYQKIKALREQYADAELIAHPECEPAILEQADFIGSTTALLNYVVKSPVKRFIVATEAGILHQMRKAAPEKELVQAPAEYSCSCNTCPHMKLNTLEKIYNTLLYEMPEVTLDSATIEAARRPIERMLEMSKELGLVSKS